MRLVLALETRFVRVRDVVYSHNLTYGRFWRRYLTQFDEVRAFARITEAAEVPAGWEAATGPGVAFLKTPYYHGPWQFLKARRALGAAARSAAAAGDAHILRVPGLMGTLLWKALCRRGRPYGVEVVGDPWDVFAPGGAKSPLRPIVRRTMRRQMARQCRDAAAALYVTREALQRRYPCAGDQVACSDVALDPEDFVSAKQLETRIQRKPRAAGEPRHCIHIGTMEQPYKRQDLLIRAARECRERGLDLRLHLVGEGRFRPEFRHLADAIGVGEQVEFAGRLPAGAAIRCALDAAECFVLPSLTEGLPRVLLEAMARGVPCLATDVGGIPELLTPEYLLSVRTTPRELAERIQWLLDTDHSGAIERNWRIAHEYAAERLAGIHKNFLGLVQSAAKRAAGSRSTGDLVASE